MSLVRVINNGSHINTMGRFYIYKETKVNNKINTKSYLANTIKFSPGTL